MKVEKNTPLLELLSIMFENTSRRKIRKMLTDGRILVDGVVVHKAQLEVEVGQIVEMIGKSKAIQETPPPRAKKKAARKLKIIHEDDHLLIVSKPDGLLSVATDKMEPDTLHSRCINYVREEDSAAWCHIVHRLDRETSGIMILAKGKWQKEALQEQFADRSIHRVYHALVEGKPELNQGTSKMYLLEDRNLRIKKSKKSTKGAKEAITHWRVEDSDDFHSLIHIIIETGRRHQIRMAMRELGCPVVGDETHGSEQDPGRLCLHASSLEFIHPENDDPVRFESPIPFITK
jgi:23S rRNA pseudouridine1911/1915/1917 synthase